VTASLSAAHDHCPSIGVMARRQLQDAARMPDCTRAVRNDEHQASEVFQGSEFLRRLWLG
jgi:hypothetical protein